MIDQFEEVFTLVDDERRARPFPEQPVGGSHRPAQPVARGHHPARRFLRSPAAYGDFGELLRERTEVVFPLTAEELERAMVGPAARVGAALEPELVAAIAQDSLAQPGTLPLLQYALTELFERRAGGR